MTRTDSARSASVLVIEDDDDIAKALETLLKRAGYRALVENDGRMGLRRFHSAGPDLVILDVGLPSLDGWTLLDRIRELSAAPVLMLTALDSETDKVRGLRGGADDYLTKPFGNPELLARVEAILRRAGDGGGEDGREDLERTGAEGANTGSGTRSSTADTGSYPRDAPGAVGPEMSPGRERTPGPGEVPPSGHDDYRENDVLIDLCCHRVEVHGAPVSLTPNEFRLLEVLVKHRGSVLSTGQLLQLAWRDPTATGPDRVKFTVLRLRRKLGWMDGADGPLETVRGFGYRLRA